jgi:hypothetical protein
MALAMPPYTGEAYTVQTKEELKACLQEHGVAILPGVLDAPKCAALAGGLWAAVEQLSQGWRVPLRRADPATWKGIYALQPKHGMLFQHWQLGQSQACWNVRQDPAVCDVFAELWGVPPAELICSFDGVALGVPPERTGRGWFQGMNKLHCDQSFTRNELDCYQGWINGQPTEPGDATLTFLRKSHRFHAEAGGRFPELLGTQHWNQLTDEMIRYYVEECGCPQECVRCPAGSLVLWDSRTIHSGRQPTRGRAQPSERAVVYVCMTPRAAATPALLRKRQKAFAEQRMTCHCPHRPMLFAKRPRCYPGQPLPEVQELPPPALTELGRALVGLPPIRGGAAAPGSEEN